MLQEELEMNDQIATLTRYSFKELPQEIEAKSLSFIYETSHPVDQQHRTEFFQLFYLSSGRLTIEIDFLETSLSVGEAILIAPGQVVRFSRQTQAEGWAVLFTPLFLGDQSEYIDLAYQLSGFSSLELNRKVLLNQEGVETTFSLLGDELSRDKDAHQAGIARSYLRILLLLMYRYRSKTPLEQTSTAVMSFVQAVEQYFHKFYQVSNYLPLIGIAEKRLAKELRVALGDTPKNYIAHRRVLEAKRLLVYSSIPIKSVGYELGFDEPTNFNKFFRKYTGESPNTFRLRHRDKPEDSYPDSP